MRKNILMLSLGLLVLSSCSVQDDDTINVQAEPDDNSPVLIQLGSGYNVGISRATIESENDGRFSSDSLGVFMLARLKTAINPETDPLTWTPGDVYQADVAKLDNEWALVNKANGRIFFRNKEGQDYGEITYHYYPIDNWYAYRFYAYQPFRTDDKVTVSDDDQRIVHYTDLDGTQDIICGSTPLTLNEQPLTDLAYCSKYFHMNGHTEEVPNIAFKHMQMRLQFYLVGEGDTTWTDPVNHPEDYTISYNDCNDMVLTELCVLSVPTKADLTVANLDGSEPSLVYDWSGPKADLYLRDRNAVVQPGEEEPRLSPVAVNGELTETIREGGVIIGADNTEKLPVGMPIMLPYDKVGVYQVAMKFESQSTGDKFTVHRIDLRPNNPYQSGKTYKIKIKVGSPQKVSVTATLAGWEDDGEGELILN